MTQKIWSLYKIVNQTNNKIYIGQTIEPKNRWYQHRRDAGNPKYPLHWAINKYGAHNFTFEILCSCITQEAANWAEELLIQQYDSLVKNGKGYNVSLGGAVAPKSDEWKQALSSWHASLSPEEKAIRSEKLREATINQIATQGHPAQGHKWNDEQKAQLSASLKALDKSLIYTPEVRKNMSDAHIGKKQSAESVKNRSEAIRRNKGDMICRAPDCGIEDRRHSSVINGIRYCSTHAMRIKTNGSLELLPRKAHNRKEFTEEQINNILLDTRAAETIGKDYGVSERVILRVRKEFKNTINPV